VNRQMVAHGDAASVYEEGCLSIPEYYAEVERPAAVTVAYLDRDGKELTLEADGLMATCLQHEIDHLNGVLFIDHISKLKRDMVVRKFRKLAKDKPAPSRLAVQDDAARRLHGHAGVFGRYLAGIGRGRPRHRRRLCPATAPRRPARAGIDEIARPSRRRGTRHRGAHAALAEGGGGAGGIPGA